MERIPEAEYAHLSKTLALIAGERARLERETGLTEDGKGTAQVPGDDETALAVFRARAETLSALWHASHSAYFAHLLFRDAEGEAHDFYIGRWGVHDPRTLNQAVVDWRAPLANLYYAGGGGKVSYEAPDGTVSGDLLLRRLLEVKEDRILSMAEGEIAGGAQWLSRALEREDAQRLHEIVTTIQAEQNLVIRAPMDRDLIVQGAAGSGKTSVCLHRVAYLLYRYRETLKPEQVMILAPSPLFLAYIADVLPGLGVERVRQTTLEALVRAEMGRRFPGKAAGKGEAWPPDAGTRRVREKKGSLAFLEALDAFLLREEEAMLPSGELTFAGMTVMGREEVRDLFLHQLSTWPLGRRIREARKPFRRRMDALCGKMKNLMEHMAGEKLDRLMQAMPDSPLRRERAGRILDSRDARLREIDEHAKAFLQELEGHFHDMDTVRVYERFLEEAGGEDMGDTLEALRGGGCFPEDLPLLLEIHRRVWGLEAEGIRYVAVDEGQDMSPVQARVLTRAFPRATFTVFSDLMQAVHPGRGIERYEDWDSVFPRSQKRVLAVSYRTSDEITALSARVAEGAHIPGLTAPGLSGRRGKAPQVRIFRSRSEQADLVLSALRQWQEAGYTSVALLCRTTAEARQVRKALLGRGLDCPVASEALESFPGGIAIWPGPSCKGLEASCAVILDASAQAFPEGMDERRLLYVFLTRPLHELLILSGGVPTPMLGEAQAYSGA